jgi:hypothetical protein
MIEATRNMVERCENELAQTGQLSFATRKALLRTFGQVLRDHRNRAVELGTGKRARARLAAAAARQVSAAWRRDFGTDDLDQLLSDVDGYLAGVVSRDDLRLEADELIGGLFDDPQGKYEAYLAARAAAGAAMVAVRDEILEPDAGITQEQLDDPQDPDHWDPAFWAAGAAAGGHPWMKGFRAEAYVAFWRWYLAIAVPSALGGA